MLRPRPSFAEAVRRQPIRQAASAPDPLDAPVEAIAPRLAPGGNRRLAILEPLTVFTLIMLYIWGLRAAHPVLWIAILGLMLLSHLIHRESPGMLGFRTHGLQYRTRWLFPLLSILTFLMLAYGALLRTTRPINPKGAVLAFAGYLPWGLLQQYILNAYFLNRFDALLPQRAASLVTATLFCVAHTPNWFLMAVTFPGGYWSTRVYRNCRCLYLLGLVHAMAGFLLFMLVPDSITHHLRVGPGWFKW